MRTGFLLDRQTKTSQRKDQDKTSDMMIKTNVRIVIESKNRTNRIDQYIKQDIVYIESKIVGSKTKTKTRGRQYKRQYTRQT